MIVLPQLPGTYGFPVRGFAALSNSFRFSSVTQLRLMGVDAPELLHCYSVGSVTVRRWRWLWLCRFFLSDPRAQAATLSKETLQEIVRGAPWLRIVLSENHPQQKRAEALIFTLHNPEKERCASHVRERAGLSSRMRPARGILTTLLIYLFLFLCCPKTQDRYHHPAVGAYKENGATGLSTRNF